MYKAQGGVHQNEDSEAQKSTKIQVIWMRQGESELSMLNCVMDDIGAVNGRFGGWRVRECSMYAHREKMCRFCVVTIFFLSKNKINV